jgi:hypothetical protein
LHPAPSRDLIPTRKTIMAVIVLDDAGIFRTGDLAVVTLIEWFAQFVVLDQSHGLLLRYNFKND